LLKKLSKTPQYGDQEDKEARTTLGAGISMAESQLFVAAAGNCGNCPWVYYPVDRAGRRVLDHRRGTDTFGAGLLFDYTGSNYVSEKGETAVG
jgi:hypothetical protein